MNITEFIKAHKEFDDLPFLVVFSHNTDFAEQGND